MASRTAGHGKCLLDSTVRSNLTHLSVTGVELDARLQTT